jgi:hypothetical protein
VNTYGYVRSNPISLIDPKGNIGIDTIAEGIIAGLIIYEGYAWYERYVDLIDCKKKCLKDNQCHLDAGDTRSYHQCEGVCVLKFSGGGKMHKGPIVGGGDDE